MNQTSPTPTPQEALAIVHVYRDKYLARIPANNFDRAIWGSLQIVSARVDSNGGNVGKAEFSIQFPPEYSNHFGTVHGGAIATLFDGLSSSALAILSHQGFWDGAEVSRDLQIKFFRPIPFDKVIRARCEVVHVGQRLATITGTLRRESDGAILATCVHEKFSPAGGKPKL